MEKKYPANGKFKAFFKKNMYYIIMGVCVLAIGAMITVALVAQKNVDNPDPSEGIPNEAENPVDNPADNPIDNPNDNPVDNPVDDPNANPVIQPIVFSIPVDGATVKNDYTMTSLTYWSTLNQYAVHNGIDYCAADGTNVKACYSGTVTSVSYDVLNGNVVKIDHGNGLTSVYSSLSEPTVAEGQTVAQGTVLGTISTSATSEMLDGAHVHFSVYKDGKIADPYDFFPEGSK